MSLDPCLAIPTKTSKSEAWVAWHKILRDNFPKSVANKVWTDAWGVRGSSDANTIALRNYMESQGVKIDSTAWDSILDFGSDVGDFFGTYLKVGQTLGIILSIGILGGVLVLIYQIIRKPELAIQAASMATPAGRVAGGVKQLN